MKNVLGNRNLVIGVMIAIIIISSAVAVGPLVYSLVMGHGVKTEGINVTKLHAAEGDLDGTWKVVQGNAHNYTSVGFTIDEVLPAERTTTSGSTTNVTGQVEISGAELKSGEVTVDMTKLTTDKKVRDQNMKDKLFKTQNFPESHFKVTKPVDLSAVPADGTVGKVELTGELTIKDQTHPVTADFDVARDGKNLVIAGDIPVNRLKFGIETPEFLAAKVADEGFVNVRVTLGK